MRLLQPSDAAAVYEVARRLAMGGEAIGARVRAGVCDPYQTCGYLFAVLNHRGETLALAHDAFEAARWFLQVEAQPGWVKWEDDAHPTVSLPSDTEIEVNELAQRMNKHRRNLARENSRRRASKPAVFGTFNGMESLR